MVSSHVCHRECLSTIWACFPVLFVYPCQTLLRSYISSHPTLCLICRAGSHKYCYICLWSFLTALPAHPPVGHRIPSRGSLLYSRFGSFQLSVYPLSVDAQASHVLADLSKYITLECLGVLHLSILRYNPLLLHQITSAPLSQPKVFFAFLNHASPSPLRSSLSQSYSLTWYAVVSWRSCTVFKIFLQGHAYEIFDTGLFY